MTLLRVLGVLFGIAVSVGGTIGVGILRLPGPIAAQLHHPWLILAVWLIAGCFLFVHLQSLSELATMLPQAGGYYVYARRAFGDGIGFIAGWADWLTQTSSVSYLAMSMADFAGMLWPAVAPHATAIGVAIILGLALLHTRGIRTSGRFQEITCALQALAFLALVFACFTRRGADAGAAFTSHPPLVIALAPITLAVRSMLGAYDGWYCAIYFTEEVRDPGRTLPRSMMGGLAAVIAMYLLINAALFYVLPIDRLAASPLAAADAAEVLFGAGGRRWITWLSLLSLPAVLNASLLISTRVLFAMSRDGLFPRVLTKVTPKGTPLTAMWVATLLAIGLALTGTFETLIGLVAILGTATACGSFLALIVLRRREPGLPRPFRARLYPWLTLFSFLAGLAFLLGAAASDPKTTAFSFGLALLSYPVFRLLRTEQRGGSGEGVG